MTTETARYAVDHGQLTDNGRPMLTLVRAAWGDDAPPAATLDALTRAIPAALNAAADMTADELTRRLYDVADDYETDTLDALRVKAGIVWLCPVAPWTVPTGEDCDDCGRSRADAIAEAARLEAIEA
jgi:hypothetical protein